jgi:hypothetical protein
MQEFYAEFSNMEFPEQAVQELADPRRRFLEQAVPEIISSRGPRKSEIASEYCGAAQFE